MPNINSIEGNAFSYLLKEHREQIPNLFFRSDLPELDVVINTLASTMEAEIPDTDLKGEERQEYVAEQVLKRYNEMKTDPKYELLFTPLSAMANNLGTSIVRTFNTLKTGVKPEVDSLKEQIEARMETILEEQDLTEDALPIPDPDGEFEVMDWNAHLNKMGGSDIIEEEFKEIAEIEPSEEPTDLTVLSRSSKLKITSLNIHPDMAATIRETFLSKATNELSRENLEAAWKIVSDSFEFGTLSNALITKPINSTNYGPEASRIAGLIDTLWPALEVMKHTPLNIPENLLEDIHKNIDLAQKLLRCGGYSLMVMRKHWKDALVLDTKLLNADSLPSMEEFHLQNSDVFKHVKMLFEERKQMIPYNGLMAKAIADDKDAVNNLYSTFEAEHVADASKIKYQATAKAMKDVLSTYLESTGPDKLGSVSIQDFVRLHQNNVTATINKLNTTVDRNMENLLYDFVLSTWYPGTMVEKANTYFGEEVVKQLELRDNLSENDLALIDARVAAKIASQFLASSVVLTK